MNKVGRDLRGWYDGNPGMEGMKEANGGSAQASSKCNPGDKEQGTSTSPHQVRIVILYSLPKKITA